MECRRGILREVEGWRCGIHELCVRLTSCDDVLRESQRLIFVHHRDSGGAPDFDHMLIKDVVSTGLQRLKRQRY